MPRLLADAIVVLHLGFVLFVVLGGLLVLRWQRLAWAHLPAALWGAVVEFSGWTCPLTPLETWLRAQAADVGYAGGFVERYVLSVLYPAMLTRNAQVALGGLVLVVNGIIYSRVIRRCR